jgi:two-component system, response regulator FlrC
VLLARGNTIDADAVELGPDLMRAPAAEAPAAGAAREGVAALVGRRVDEVERDLILHTLRHTEGNRTHAATILGISIRALRNKLRDYAAEGVAVPPPSAGVAA